MAMIRSAIYGGVAALGVPTVLDLIDLGWFDFLVTSAKAFEIGGVWFRWSWPIFVGVTLLSFILLQLSRDR